MTLCSLAPDLVFEYTRDESTSNVTSYMPVLIWNKVEYSGRGQSLSETENACVLPAHLTP